jgi:hypothetical protein
MFHFEFVRRKNNLRVALLLLLLLDLGRVSVAAVAASAVIKRV